MGEGKKHDHDKVDNHETNKTEQHAGGDIYNGPVKINNNHGGGGCGGNCGHDHHHDGHRPRPHLRRLALIGVATTSAVLSVSVALNSCGHATPGGTGVIPTPTPAPVTNPQPAPSPQPVVPVGNPGQQAQFVETPGLPFQPQMQADGTMQLTASKTDIAPQGDANVSFRIHERNGNVPVILDQSGVSCNGCTDVVNGDGQVMQVGDVSKGGEVDFLISWKPSQRGGHAQLQVQANGNPNWECLGNIYEGRTGPGA